MSTDAIRGASTAQDDAPTTELVTGVVGDRCPNCQAPMAADQRYCLNCGERRGRARFSPTTFAAPAAAAGGTTETTVVSHHHRSRFSGGATLVAGVATLLIALGVGVLIGHNSNTGKAPTQPIITVGGGGAATNSASTPATTTPASTGKASKKVAKATVVHVTAKAAKAATAAAGKVLGSSKNLSNNVQQSVGGSCSGGAGCQGGKFTGNFFPNG
ncbi:MAG TPA: zinc ribbon domain-containing protein [Solirubrobacteraceae bacterium]|nr:zinc ribbon domain-containing protein [Solirubrobacteraceae bacterium]